MGVNSRLKVLGRAKNVFVNINRTKVEEEVGNSSSLLNFGNPFKKIKEKFFSENNNELSLDSEKEPVVVKARKEMKKEMYPIEEVESSKFIEKPVKRVKIIEE